MASPYNNTRSIILNKDKVFPFFEYDFHFLNGKDLNPLEENSVPAEFLIRTKFNPNEIVKSLKKNNTSPVGGVKTLATIGIEISDIHLSGLETNSVASVYRNIAVQEVFKGKKNSGLEKLVCAIYFTYRDVDASNLSKPAGGVIYVPYSVLPQFREQQYPITIFPSKNEDALIDFSDIVLLEEMKVFRNNGLHEIEAYGMGTPFLDENYFYQEMMEFLTASCDPKLIKPEISPYHEAVYLKTNLQGYLEAFLSGNTTTPLATGRIVNFDIAVKGRPSSVFPGFEFTQPDMQSLFTNFKAPSTFQHAFQLPLFQNVLHPMSWTFPVQPRPGQELLKRLPLMYFTVPRFPNKNNVNPRNDQTINRQLLNQATDTCIVEIIGAADNKLNDQTTNFTNVFKVYTNSGGVVIGVKRMGSNSNPQLMTEVSLTDNIDFKFLLQNKHGDYYGLADRLNWITTKMTLYEGTIRTVTGN